jgi:hypothetical protein
VKVLEKPIPAGDCACMRRTSPARIRWVVSGVGTRDEVGVACVNCILAGWSPIGCVLLVWRYLLKSTGEAIVSFVSKPLVKHFGFIRSGACYIQHIQCHCIPILCLLQTSSTGQASRMFRIHAVR